jgi:CheY-like chemotaxis protein
MKKILIVDDEATLRLLMRKFLEKAGYQVSEAEDGEKGIIKAKETTPDLILLDVTMPKINGYQVDQELGADPNLKKIPVILVTGTSQVVGDGIKLKTHAKHKLAKPFDRDQLLNKVKEVLGN